MEGRFLARSRARVAYGRIGVWAYRRGIIVLAAIFGGARLPNNLQCLADPTAYPAAKFFLGQTAAEPSSFGLRRENVPATNRPRTRRRPRPRRVLPSVTAPPLVDLRELENSGCHRRRSNPRTTTSMSTI
jgi:hypothetical protein